MGADVASKTEGQETAMEANASPWTRTMETLGEAEDEDLTQMELPASRGRLDVDLIVEKVGLAADEVDGDGCGTKGAFPLTQTPFPSDRARANVLDVKEHGCFAGVVCTYSIAKVDDGDGGEECATGNHGLSFVGCPAANSKSLLADARNDESGSEGSRKSGDATWSPPPGTLVGEKQPNASPTATLIKDGSAAFQIAGRENGKASNGAPRPTVRNRNEERWENRFAELVEFRRQRGHCNVPKTLGELGSWVNYQRELYRGKRKSTLKQEYISRLDAVGFDWKAGKMKCHSLASTSAIRNPDVLDDMSSESEGSPLRVEERVHECLTAEPYASRYSNRRWYLEAKQPYQQYACRAPSCKKRVRTYCACTPGHWLCKVHHLDHAVAIRVGHTVDG